MTQEEAIAIAKKYKEMVAEKLPLKALYLYGSYSKGNHREDSDIELQKQEYLFNQLPIPIKGHLLS